MFQFDVNKPIDDPRLIAAAIGDYQTPEAAEADFRAHAPQGMDYLTKEYQRLTGDAFADPFADVSKRRADAMTQAALGGASVATGSNAGMRLLRMPTGGVSDSTAVDLGIASRAPQTMALPPRMLPMQAPGQVATLQQPTTAPATPMDAWSRLFPNVTTVKPELVQQATMDSAVKANTRNTQFNSSQLQIPDATSPDFFNILGQRSSIAGVPNEFEKILKSDPSIFGNPTDPRFAVDAKGKAIHDDALSKIVTHPVFMDLQRRNPQAASDAYTAWTGRNLNVDIEAKRGALAKNQDEQDRILSGLKNVHYDPVTNEPYHTIETKDIGGDTVKQQDVPLSPLYQAMLEARGGKIAGITVPGYGGIRATMPKQGEKFYTDYTNTYKDLRTKNPSLSSAQLQQMTAASLKSGLTSNSSAGPSDKNLGVGEVLAQVNPAEIAADMFTAVPRMGANVAKGGINLGIRETNALMALFGRNERMPLIPNVPGVPVDSISDFNTGPNVAARGDAARYFASRFTPATEAFTGATPTAPQVDPITLAMRKRALAVKIARSNLPSPILRQLLPQLFQPPFQDAMAGQ